MKIILLFCLALSLASSVVFAQVQPQVKPLPPDIKAAIRAFEAEGGTGQYFSAPLNSRLGGQPQESYVIHSVPQRPNRNSSVFLLRTEDTRLFFEQILEAGGPIVFTFLDSEKSQVFGAVDLDSEFTRAAAAASLKPDSRAALLIQPDTDPYTFAHESRHLLDRTNGLDQMFNAFRDWTARNNLQNHYTVLMIQIVEEYRGHLTQQIFASNAFRRRAVLTDRIGQIMAPFTEENKVTEIAIAGSAFYQAYTQLISALMSPLSPEAKTDLREVIRPYVIETPMDANLLRLERLLEL